MGIKEFLGLQAPILIRRSVKWLIYIQKSKAGKEFDAYLVADKTEKKVKFEFLKKT